MVAQRFNAESGLQRYLAAHPELLSARSASYQAGFDARWAKHSVGFVLFARTIPDPLPMARRR